MTRGSLLLGLACARHLREAPPPPAHVPRPDADLVYFVLVDRFADGRPGGATDPADPQAFHGGDLDGILDHLDHLQALGVRTLWLSPVFEMRGEKIDEWGAFHGYWVRDLARVEPRFGGEEALARLSDELHLRGMRLVLDLVLNHTDYDAPIRAAHPDWFHPVRDIADWDDPQELVSRQVHGLPDLAQENEATARYLLDTSVGWLDRVNVDGYRIDAVRHMPLDFLARLNDALDARAEGGFWTLGEDFQGGALLLAETWRAGRFDAMFDFPLRYAMVDVFCKDAPPGRVGATLASDRFYADPNALVTFLDNHDLPRVTTECGGSRARVHRALLFLFATRGTPAITYGTEALLPGGAEPDNRRDMPWEEVGYTSPIGSLQRFRAAHPALHRGRTAAVDLREDALALLRSEGDEAALVVINAGSVPYDPPLPDSVRRARLERRVSAGADGSLRLVELSPPEPPGLVSVEGGSVEVLVFRGVPSAPPPAEIPISIRAEDAPLGEGDALLLVGSDPETGGWDPARGIPFLPGKDGWEAPAVSLPEGSVLAWKLVIRRAGGAVEWEERPDRYLLARGPVAQAAVAWNR